MEVADTTLRCLPCDSQDLGSGKCRLGPKLMEEIGAYVGCPVRVHIGRKHILCTAWPREDCFEGIIQVDETVYSNATEEVSSLRKEHITVLRAGKPEAVEVTAVLSDLAHISSFKQMLKTSGHCAQLNKYCKNVLLKQIIPSKGCTVNCQQNKLGKMYKLAYLLIKQHSSNESYRLVSPNTKVTVTDVMSKERYEQKAGEHCAVLLGGLERPARVLRELIQLPLLYSENYRKLGLQSCKGILLHGPPGCGKTSLVRTIARDCDAFLMCINGPEIFAPHPGETEENMRNIFKKAVEMSREGATILFIDELDSICPKSSKNSDSQDNRVISQLVSLMDTLQFHDGLIVVAATNRPNALDPTLRRPGRFDKEVLIGVPTFEQRRQILQAHCSRMPIAEDVDIDALAEATPGFVGADLANLCQEAAYLVLSAQSKDQMGAIVPVNMSNFKEALSHIVPSTQRGSDILVDSRPVLWNQIGGLDDVKTEIKQAIEWPLKHPEAFTRLGIRRPKGVLLYGPPGCSKTTLVRAAATSCKVTFLSVSGAQLYSPFVGDSERALTDVFHQARMGAPSILFIDEIDSIVGKRGDSQGVRGVEERLLSTLLNEMDGIGIKLADKRGEDACSAMLMEGEENREKADQTEEVDNNDVIIIAATNRPDMIDDALLRPGRFDRIVHVPPPDYKARLQILKVHSKNIPVSDVDLEVMAEKTERFTGADIENLCREAALRALTEDGLNTNQVTQKHFLDTLQMLQPSLSSDQLAKYSEIKPYKR